MNTKILVAIAALATVGLTATAEAKRDDRNEAAWAETVRSVPSPAAISQALSHPVVVEGRNVSVPAADRVEPYIAQSIEQDGRGNK